MIDHPIQYGILSNQTAYKPCPQKFDRINLPFKWSSGSFSIPNIPDVTSHG
uniref:Uncharacterized protein n=1 Tax=Arundo donax TaxID=35708 RepID=A0A0A9C4P5_ARUDO